MSSQSKHKKQKQKVKSTAAPVVAKRKPEQKKFPLVWLLLILVVTGICFAPMLENHFTNWDDEYYVVNNMLLRGPDWKGIFTQPVVSNYHPLTIISLAINYGLTGSNPSSYLILNLLLHLANTALVFYFIWTLSNKKLWVAAVTALIFGIHPLHASVADAAPRAASIAAEDGLHPSCPFEGVPVAVIVGAVTSTVHVTVRDVVAVLPHASVAVNVLVCVRIHPVP